MKINNITKNIMDLNFKKIFSIIPNIPPIDYEIIYKEYGPKHQDKIIEIVCYEQLDNSTRTNVYTAILFCKTSKIFHKKVYLVDTQTGDIPSDIFNKDITFYDIAVSFITAPYIYALGENFNKESMIHFYGNTRVKFSNKKKFLRYLHSLIPNDTYNLFFAKILLEHPELTDINTFFNLDI